MSSGAVYAALIIAVIAIIIAIIAIILFFVARPTSTTIFTTQIVTPSNGEATINVAPNVIFVVNSGSTATSNVDLKFNTGENGSLFGVRNSGSGTLTYGSTSTTSQIISAGNVQFFIQTSGSISPISVQ